MKTVMHARTQLLAVIGLIAALLLPCASRAADVDIYSGLSGAAGNPNILIIMDNAANFDAATTASPCVINGATNTMAKSATTNSAGGIEQCALYSVITSLPANVNIGVMIYNATGILDYNGTTTCQAAGSGGGCLAYPLQAMTAANKPALLNWIANWTPQTIKTSAEADAEAMQEAWAYYAGQIGLSGRNYVNIQPQAGCQKNFVVFLGNSFTSSASPGDAPNTANASLQSAYTTAGVTNPGLILGTMNTTCGSFTFDTTDSLHNNNGEYLDEWARFMKNTADIYPGSTGQQSIITYTIGLVDPASCKPIYPATMKSAANYGGGEYFETSSSADIVAAMMKILNEVQAVNSVFSSATLPVSVNTQGTYLNQIYMGMFRPDQQGNPRWVGNVKQYQFQFDSNKNLYLADATREPAISSAGTGFITPGAANFWSCTNSTHSGTLSGPVQLAGYSTFIPYSGLPTCGLDPLSGFWANNGIDLTSTAGGAYDLPDGEVVEKGGAGQQIRLENLTDDYTLAAQTAPTAGTTGNPRRLYTYCPSGSGCVPNLTDPTNAFSVTNLSTLASWVSVPPTIYGSGFNIGITALIRTGGLYVTATTVGANGLSPGNTVTITGATPNDYNGTYSVVSASGNQFTYQLAHEWPPATATTTTTGGIGGYVASLQPTLTYPTTLNRAAAGTSANAVVTATTGTTNPFTQGENVTIAGAAPTNYNLTAPVTIVTSGSVFQYPVSVQPTPTPTGVYAVDLTYNQALQIKTAVCSSKTVTITTSTNHNLVNGDWVKISGDNQTKSYNTATTITWASATSFSYGVTNCPGPSPTTSTMVMNSGPPSAVTQANGYSVTLTRNETAVGSATVSATFNIPSPWFASNDLINVWLATGTQNASETGYLVSGVPITCAVTTTSGACGPNANGTTTIYYTITTTPSTQGAGTIYSYPYLAGSTQPLAANGGLTRAPYPAYPTATTATATLVTGATTLGFCNGDTVNIAPAAGTTLAAHEGAYTGNWVITGTVPCDLTTCAATTTVCGNGTTNTAYYGFTYGALALGPISPASPANPPGPITATAPTIAPDPTTLTNWVRGEDNFGGEQSLCGPGSTAGVGTCPSPAVTIRPSVHGDTLHSRPIAVNYGGNIGVIVYYGTNDGVYHAINGNQPPCTVSPCATPVAPQTTIPSTITYTSTSGATISVPPGGELWGFISPEFYGKLNRQRLNSPPLLLPSTPSNIGAEPKDYFIDGPTGLYQEVDGNGTTVKAWIFIGERRGGMAITALDVTNPFQPIRKWRIDNSTLGFTELAQTWSLPKPARLKGYCSGSTCSASNPPSPVLIFGAGYDDGSEDAEYPFSASFNGFGGNIGADNTGRGIFVVDAFTGNLIWAASHFDNLGAGWPTYWYAYTGFTGSFPGASCSGTPPAAVTCQILGLNYSIPADVTLIDRDSDGYIDRMYATDTGGDIWRMDFEPAGGITPDKWQISNLAALGCAWGPCDTELWSSPTYANPVPVQRKFFFPAEFIPATSGANYDAVVVGSGDREHPLYVCSNSTAASPCPLASSPPYAYSSQAVVNRIYVIKDFNKGKDALGSTATIPWLGPITELGYGIMAALPMDDCTGTSANPNTCSTATTQASTPMSYDKLTAPQQHYGYFISLAAGEKVVNAPNVTAGYVYLGTNQPVPQNNNSCTTNLGIARGYQINPFTGQHASVIYDGGGLPPSPVSGIVDIVTDTGTIQAPFCIGCPNAIAPNGNQNCNNSALAACRPNISVNSARTRNYWYINNR